MYFIRLVLIFFMMFLSVQLYAETYKLPFPKGKSYSITQCGSGYTGSTSFSHNGKMMYAWDFGMAQGQEISSIADGIITYVEDRYEQGKCLESFASKGNRVVIKHADGNSSLYLHLLKDSITVKVGQHVKQGQIIGKSGASGYVCSNYGGDGAHLHFQLQETCNGWYCQSKKIAFEEQAQCKAGINVVSQNTKPSEILSVTDFWHTADPIYTNSSFDAQFKLQNNSQSGVTVKSIAMSIHDSNNSFLFDMYLESNVYIAAGSYYQVPKTYKNAPSTAGTYQVVAKIQEDNGNWKELKSDPFIVHARSDSSSNNNDKASQYIDKCISALSQYCGSKVGEKYSCKENSLCQETTGGQFANVTNIAIDKNITGNEFYYYWDTYGGWSKNGLTLSYCGITATTTDNSANKADGFENRWKSSVKLTVDGNNSWKIIDKSDGYFNICQSSDTNNCLHNEYGSLQLSDIESHWYSAMWYFEDAGNGYINIRNKWKQSEYIHIEYGSPAVGGIESGWLSAQWKRFKF